MLHRLSSGEMAALLTALVGAACLLMSADEPRLTRWPATLTLPVADWIGAAVDAVVSGFKAVAHWNGVFLNCRWVLRPGFLSSRPIR